MPWVVIAFVGSAESAGEADGRSTWCEVYPPSFSAELRAASFPARRVGVVVGGIHPTSREIAVFDGLDDLASQAFDGPIVVELFFYGQDDAGELLILENAVDPTRKVRVRQVMGNHQGVSAEKLSSKLEQVVCHGARRPRRATKPKCFLPWEMSLGVFVPVTNMTNPTRPEIKHVRLGRLCES
jgi:hypothetical protein